MFMFSYVILEKVKKMEETLYEKLDKLKNSKEYAFHMPGHKREEKTGPFADIMRMDITEIEGFDNLHHAEGILRKEQDFAADLYGAKDSFFLVNGSTAGILASICAVAKEGTDIVFSRNAHKSAYHALYIKGLCAQYVYPEYVAEKAFIHGKIDPQDVKKQMEKTKAKVVFITSPTYEGIVSDISSIAQIVHEKDGILIVDEAHGAHFGFHPYFPQSAVKMGADIVIQSLHKTLPSLTQTALLHICSDKVDSCEVARWLSIFQTSSPSYVLMGSMSRCLHLLADHAEIYFSQYKKNLGKFYSKMKNLTCLEVPDPAMLQRWFQTDTDPSKIIICVENLKDKEGKKFTAKQLAEKLLADYEIQIEMVSENYVLAMTSIYDSEEGFRRLEEALLDIDSRLMRRSTVNMEEHLPTNCDVKAQPVMTIKKAIDGKKEKRAWKDCVGKVSAEYIYLYPPGSPIIAPGEMMTEQVLKEISIYKKQGLNVLGPADDTLKEIMTVK